MTLTKPINPENKYDWKDVVDQTSMMRAGLLKMASYRVRDPETGEFSERMFHATYDNTVMAVMSESAAKLFALFINNTLNPPEWGKGDEGKS